MNPRLPVAAIVALALGLSGCVDDNRMFFIRQNQAPGSSCTVDTSASAAALWGGIFDLKAPGFDYLMNPLVENQMLSTVGDKQPERNRLHMLRFDIELELEGAGSLGESSHDVAGVIDPNGTAVFAGVPVIPAQVASQLQLQPGQQRLLRVKLRAIADRSGDDMESAEFIFPVTLCNECIVDWKDQCPASDSTEDVLTNACGLPQDSPVTCCRTADNAVACLSK
jgi:hypothetical protein